MDISHIREQARELRSALGDLEVIHQKLISEISLENHDRRLAIYILCGRAITLCYSSVLMLEQGHLAELGALIRLVEETVYAADYFHDLDDDSEIIIKWFNNEVISPKRARKAQGQLFLKVAGERHDKFNAAIDDLYGILSTYIHPTYGISKANLNVYTLRFDYQWEEITEYNINLFASVTQIVISTINAILYSRDLYKISDSEFDQLTNMRKSLFKLDI